MFRTEVLAARADRLKGDVVITVPLSWQLLGYFLFGTLCIIAAFLVFGEYSRVETAAGAIMPDKGVVVVVPSRPGTVIDIPVAEGDVVDEHDLLATVRVDEYLPDGSAVTANSEAALNRQDSSISEQLESSRRAYEAERSENDELQSGIKAEIALIEEQIESQRRIVQLSNEALAKLKKAADQGWVSDRDLQIRTEDAIARQTELMRLQQQLSNRRSALVQAKRSASQIDARSSQDAAALQGARAQVMQQLSTVQATRGYALQASVSGRVTAITARVGRRVATDQPLMSIVPVDGILQAEVNVAPAAIGFIRPGQDVQVSIDTFPYQRFGTIRGTVREVPTSAIEQRRSVDGRSSDGYPVVIQLERIYIDAFGKKQFLMPGMTVVARIATEKQSFAEWLFEPVFSVRRR